MKKRGSITLVQRKIPALGWESKGGGHLESLEREVVSARRDGHAHAAPPSLHRPYNAGDRIRNPAGVI
jgi:hypothetical protein